MSFAVFIRENFRKNYRSNTISVISSEIWEGVSFHLFYIRVIGNVLSSFVYMITQFDKALQGFVKNGKITPLIFFNAPVVIIFQWVQQLKDLTMKKRKTYIQIIIY